MTRYRYPEDPSGVGVTTTLRGPERVFRLRLTKPAANFGVVIIHRGRGSRVEPRVVAGLDENRLTGYAGLPINHNPYMDEFHAADARGRSALADPGGVRTLSSTARGEPARARSVSATGSTT